MSFTITQRDMCESCKFFSEGRIATPEPKNHFEVERCCLHAIAGTVCFPQPRQIAMEIRVSYGDKSICIPERRYDFREQVGGFCRGNMLKPIRFGEFLLELGEFILESLPDVPPKVVEYVAVRERMLLNIIRRHEKTYDDEIRRLQRISDHRQEHIMASARMKEINAAQDARIKNMGPLSF
jgi:hypothetical protein